MDKMVGTLRQFFAALQHGQDSVWSRSQPAKWKRVPSARAKRTYEMLQNKMRPIGEKELSDLLSPARLVEIDFATLNRFLYLPPLEKNAEFVPVLSLKYHLDGERKEIRLRVMLYSFDNNAGRLYGVGFRLESPESESQVRDNAEDEDEDEEESGSHDFYHAQLIRSLRGGLPVESLDWLPCTQPSFPVTADCPVTLTICLLLTLYGKRYCKEFLESYQIFDLHRYMRSLDRWVNWGQT